MLLSRKEFDYIIVIELHFAPELSIDRVSALLLKLPPSSSVTSALLSSLIVCCAHILTRSGLCRSTPCGAVLDMVDLLPHSARDSAQS